MKLHFLNITLFKKNVLFQTKLANRNILNLIENILNVQKHFFVFIFKIFPEFSPEDTSLFKDDLRFPKNDLTLKKTASF